MRRVGAAHAIKGQLSPSEIFQREKLRAFASKHGLFCLTASVLVAAIAFGGATGNGFPGDVFLQFLAVILLIAALRDIATSGTFRHFQWPLILVTALVAIPLIQLLPLPPDLSSRLPGRALISQTYALIDQPLPPLPLSMTPSATWLSALALLPPVAVFLATLTLDYSERRRISYVLIAMGILSVFVGLLQLAQGPNSALRFYEITNKTEAVGFFANRNHFAALLYAMTLFVAAHLTDAIGSAGQKTGRRRFESETVAPLLMWLTALFMLTAAQMMARSRAGLILGDLALAAAIVIGMTDRRISGRSLGRMILGFVAAVILLLLPLAIYRIFDRFGADPYGDARLAFARKTASAAYAYMPFGSGLGSFVPVYQLTETVSDLSPSYVNHAHNDFLEVWLETGILGLAVLVLIGAATVRRTVSLWKQPSRGLHGINIALARAASVVVLLLALHSLVDYPLRTTAMMTVAAVALAFLIAPAQQREKRPTNRTVSRTRGSVGSETPLESRRTPPPALEAWKPTREWPESWQRPASHSGAPPSPHGEGTS